ncbi:MAG: beta-propeller domain-containing protein, partial [Steroidobacteraceae bacterium]
DAGIANGVKVELFDVANITQPRSLGVEVFGRAGSSSEATDDPHAVTFLSREDTSLYRFALPVTVYDTPHATQPGVFRWTYSGIHLLEVDGRGSNTPQLKSAGVIKTAEPGAGQEFPPYFVPNRGVLHDESAFAIYGEAITGRTWASAVSF